MYVSLPLTLPYRYMYDSLSLYLSLSLNLRYRYMHDSLSLCLSLSPRYMYDSLSVCLSVVLLADLLSWPRFGGGRGFQPPLYA